MADFSEDKILNMQRYFTDSADMGKLYINYSMIESYQHMFTVPDYEYEEQKVPVTLQPGAKYKKLVKDTLISQCVNFPVKIKEILSKRFMINDVGTCECCANYILDISESAGLMENLYGILHDVLGQDQLHTAQYQLKHMITQKSYTQKHLTYWNYMRKLFIQIILHNICKANRIQNEVSRDLVNGYIWVLNTCIFIVADYNFNLISDK